MARARVEQVDLVAAVEQQEDALAGEGKHLFVMELWDINLDALAGGGVEEAAATDPGESLLRFVEQDPPPGMEPAIEATVRARVRGAAPPQTAHGAEAKVVGYEPTCPAPRLTDSLLRSRTAARIRSIRRGRSRG